MTDFNRIPVVMYVSDKAEDAVDLGTHTPTELRDLIAIIRENGAWFGGDVYLFDDAGYDFDACRFEIIVKRNG
jgi:hypothetical protein